MATEHNTPEKTQTIGDGPLRVSGWAYHVPRPPRRKPRWLRYLLSLDLVSLYPWLLLIGAGFLIYALVRGVR